MWDAGNHAFLLSEAHVQGSAGQCLHMLSACPGRAYLFAQMLVASCLLRTNSASTQALSLVIC
jgi:hypothetical protein